MIPRTARIPRFITLFCIVTLSGWTGCAPRNDQSLKKILLKVDELAQQREDDQRDLQELDSRLFLLEDKVDTLKVNQQRKAEPKRHPVIRINPSASRQEEPAPRPMRGTFNNNELVEQAPNSGGQSIVESSDVDYVGDAKKNGPRPMLRLNGSSSAPAFQIRPARSKPAHTKTSPAAGTLNNERLAVVPVPRGSASSQAAAPPDPAPAPQKKATSGKDPVKFYQHGLRELRAGNYTSAIKIFKSFVAMNSEHGHADNALYWLGECYYDTRDFRSALVQFRKVVTDYPDGNKVPDSMLKMAFCQLKLGDKTAACRVLKQTKERYPKDRVFKLAADALTKKCK